MLKDDQFVRGRKTGAKQPVKSAAANRIDGVIITFNHITVARKPEADLRALGGKDRKRESEI